MSGTAPRLRQDRWGEKIRRAFDRVAPAFATNDFLYREMARRMDERLAPAVMPVPPEVARWFGRP